MSDQFRLPNGQTVRTGNIAPETRPLTFRAYPLDEYLPIDEIADIIRNPYRSPRRQLFGDDWIMNQGRLGSCNAYMAAGMLRRARYLTGQPDKELQPEFIYMHINGGQDRGSMLDDGMHFVEENGCCEKGMVPYEEYRKDRIQMEDMRRATQNAKQFRAFECYAFAGDSLEEIWHGMLSAVARGEQVGVAVHVGNNYMRTPSRADVFYGFDSGPGNHAVACDDAIALNDNPKSPFDFALDQYGSWGLQHAYRGRGRLAPRHVEETMRYHAAYAIRSTVANQNEDQPKVQ